MKYISQTIIAFAIVALVSPFVVSSVNAQTATPLIGVRKYDNTLEAKYGIYDAWTPMGNQGSVTKLRTAGNRMFVLLLTNGSNTLYGRDTTSGWRTLATGITGYEVSDNLIVTWQPDPLGGSIIRAKAGLDDQWTPIASQTPINPNSDSVKVSGTRIAYVTSGGTLRVKQDISGPWYDVSTSAGSGWDWDISQHYVVLRQGGSTILGRSALTGGWTTLANNFNSVTQVKVAATRIGALAWDSSKNASVLKVKDGINGTWYDMENGVVDWDISPQYIVVRGKIGDASRLEVKQGLFDPWIDLGTNNGYERVYVYGTKIAYWVGGTLYGWADKNSPKATLETQVSDFSIGPNQ